MKLINPKNTKTLRSKLRQEATLPERLLWKYLRDKQLGCKFRRQYGVGPYIVDFCCPSNFIVIEIDGEIHGYEFQHKKDEARDYFLVKNGYKIIRYQAKDVLNDMAGVYSDIKKVLEYY